MQIESMTIFSTGLSLKGARKTERKTKDDRQNRGITKDIQLKIETKEKNVILDYSIY